MIEIITNHLPLIIFLVVVLAIILLFIRTDGLEQRLAEANERHIRALSKINDPIKEHGRRLCGVSDTLGHLVDRLGRLEDLATPAPLGTVYDPTPVEVNRSDERLIKQLAALQKEFSEKGYRLSYELVYPPK